MMLQSSDKFKLTQVHIVDNNTLTPVHMMQVKLAAQSAQY